MDAAEPVSKPKKAVILFSEARIRVWAPLDERDPCIAGYVFFEGPTPIAARRKAEAWRAEELAKIERGRIASEARVAAMAAAREARKAAPK